MIHKQFLNKKKGCNFWKVDSKRTNKLESYLSKNRKKIFLYS